MKKSKWVSLVLASTLLSLPLISACSVEANDPQEETSTTGTVAMALSTVTPSGTEYRLSNAAFFIDGPSSTVLQSSPDPMETVLSTVLATGDYQATLANGWILQRNDGMGFVSVQADLVSPNPVPFTIFDAQRTDLVFQFNTDGTIITIGTGELGISIAVNETGGGDNCEPLGIGCNPGVEWCAPGSLIGENTCLPAGPIPIGSPCDGAQQQCVINTICADAGQGTQCIELCRFDQIGLLCAGAGGVCTDVGFPDFGACF